MLLMAGDRLVDIEERYMHLEKLVEQLDEIVTDQQAQIERLTRQLNALREEMQPKQEEGEEPPPPHY